MTSVPDPLSDSLPMLTQPIALQRCLACLNTRARSVNTQFVCTLVKDPNEYYVKKSNLLPSNKMYDLSTKRYINKKTLPSIRYLVKQLSANQKYDLSTNRTHFVYTLDKDPNQNMSITNGSCEATKYMICHKRDMNIVKDPNEESSCQQSNLLPAAKRMICHPTDTYLLYTGKTSINNLPSTRYSSSQKSTCN